MVSRHDAAPERHVHVTSAFRRLPLCFEPRDGGRRRHAVERHVDDRRHAAGGRGARRRVEAFPFGAAGFVDVHVGVDDTGGDDKSAGVEKIAAGRTIVVRSDANDPPVLDVNGGCFFAAWKDDARALYDQHCIRSAWLS